MKPVTISEGARDEKKTECEGCEASCQTACKTSCTVGNQVCEE
ncbi:MAG TPA: six-cysteine peptide SCIFF [Firmicutes bacterium]|nr:six-cysteine peptide SCIFF [Bacillota bacterium]